jgi:hypothetical protein
LKHLKPLTPTRIETHRQWRSVRGDSGLHATSPLLGSFLYLRKTSFYGITLPQFAAAGVVFGFVLLRWWIARGLGGMTLDDALSDSHAAMNYHFIWASVFTFGGLLALVGSSASRSLRPSIHNSGGAPSISSSSDGQVGAPGRMCKRLTSLGPSLPAAVAGNGDVFREKSAPLGRFLRLPHGSHPTGIGVDGPDHQSLDGRGLSARARAWNQAARRILPLGKRTIPATSSSEAARDTDVMGRILSETLDVHGGALAASEQAGPDQAAESSRAT